MMRGKKKNNPNQTDTVIGEGSKIEGKITSQAGLRLDGHVEGDISCSGDVTIGAKGTAVSHIRARNVYNAGTIHGTVTTGGLLSLTETGRLFGSIRAASLSIAQGGLFQGESQMDSKSKSETSANATPLKAINERDQEAAQQKSAASR